ncbi:aminotransferase DegT [Paenibacillus baekrokdamisoli]|uniref:Aminotransferase DegT n=1 Tax=Paenibacillus baekrokdamisoli TaxID=1712516 RepID=A0A3G9IYF4_9BACL|nr:DegT/DnrJ/EryC1/StrS family aminotransferase [Paenibacillus baekrokdamisoli]MBB3069096.1 perosamine synthetase [Paenibacillus baekrokdamisoli]BBH23910.1 aminotransferase DegT [Paenibacillus baekrokdamisoli]
MISIANPRIEEDEIQAVVEVMRTGQLAQGEVVQRFEDQFAAHFGYDCASAVSNGTTALHVALLAAGVKRNDLVLTTPFSFIATTNAILYCGAIPCFVDIDGDTFNISPERLRESISKWPSAKYLLIPHLFGLACDMGAIMAIANLHGLIVIEDCAQAHGALYNDQPVGSFGLAGTFSFYPTKNMTTGEGGMIVSSELDYIRLCHTYINHGSTERYVHEVTGFNYRMTNMAAAIGITQLSKIDQYNQRRKQNARYFLDNMNNEFIRMPVFAANAEHVFHQFTVKTEHREALMKHLSSRGIGYGVYYPIPIHLQKNVIDYFEGLTQTAELPSLPVTEKVSKEVLALPVHPHLEEYQLEQIVAAINDFDPES